MRRRAAATRSLLFVLGVVGGDDVSRLGGGGFGGVRNVDVLQALKFEANDVRTMAGRLGDAFPAAPGTPRPPARAFHVSGCAGTQLHGAVEMRSVERACS